MPLTGLPIIRLAVVVGLVLVGALVVAVSVPAALRPEHRSPAATPEATESVVSPAASSSAPAGLDGSFVAPDGDDEGPGTEEKPWRTVARALQSESRHIWLRGGQHGGFEIQRGGEAASPLVIEAYPGEEPVVSAAQPAYAISIAGATHVTLRGLTVTGASEAFGAGVAVGEGAQAITIEGNRIVGNRSFGIEVSGATDVTIHGNAIEENDTGIRLIAESDGSEVGEVLIEDNDIHGNAGMVVNDSAPNNDFGANAIIFHETTGSIVVHRNRISGHRAESIDYGTDGGAFEIWGASNLEISENLVWDNENVLETGSGGEPCENISFVRNVAYNAASWGRSIGMILRCASDSIVAHNTFDGLDWFTWELSHEEPGSTFGHSIDGLRILNNISVNSRAYVIRTDLPDGVVLDYNLFHRDAGDPGEDAHELAHITGRGGIGDLADLRAATGRELHSLSGDPLFADREARDYSLTPDSPAVDAGLLMEQPYEGSGPDLGRFELP